MTTCPECQQSLSVDDLEARCCSACGCALDQAEPPTADPPAADESESADESSPQSAQTLPDEAESTSAEHASTRGDLKNDKGTVDERHLQATIDMEVEPPSEDDGLSTRTFSSLDVHAAPTAADLSDTAQSGTSNESASQAGRSSSYEETIDSVDVPDSAVPPVDEQYVTQTFDSSVAKPGTVAENRGDGTIDSRELSSRDAERMLAMWGSAAREAQQGMTIKEKSTSGDQLKSNLVIHSRSFTAHGTSKPSEAKISNADYEMLDLLGKGGMAVVYSARQASVDRVVAVKMIKTDLGRDSRYRQKFLSEAVVTGDLEHPNIVPIYELGSTADGALFYAMKRVRGKAWSKEIRPNDLVVNLEILMKVADAVGFAHSRGVIHRDLKPENVMLGDFGEVLVMDWGLAVATTSYTKSGNIAQVCSMGGTPAYMAPEMAAGHVQKIGPASDIYLLGAILFEIITGKPPHRGRDTMKCLFAAAKNQIQETDHRGELYEIAMRAMATRPKERYATVEEFQTAIREYQSHSESILLSERATEDLQSASESQDYADFSRAIFGFEQAVELWPGNDRARQGLSTARFVNAEIAFSKDDLDLAGSLLDAKDPNHSDLLDKVRDAQQERDARLHRLDAARRATRALVAAIVVIATGSFVWILIAMNTASKERDAASKQRDVAFKERKKAMQASTAAKVAQADAETQRDRANRLKGEAESDRDDAQMARMEAEDERNRARDARDLAQYEAYLALIGMAAAQIDENAFEVAAEKLDLCAKELRNWEWGRLKYLCDHHVRSYDVDVRVSAVALDAERGRIVTGGLNGMVEVFNLEDGESLLQIPQGVGCIVNATAVSPDGKYIATGCADDQAGAAGDRYLRLWNAETGELVGALVGHAGTVLSVKFSADGTQLLSTSVDRTARVWNVERREEDATLVGHRGWVWDADFSPVTSQLVTASQDGTAIVWNLTSDGPRALPAFREHQGPVFSVAFSPDGTHVASGGYDNQVLLWPVGELREFEFTKVIENEFLPLEEQLPLDTIRFQSFAGHTDGVRRVRFSGSGNLLLSCGDDNSVRLWRVDTGQLLKNLRGHGGWVRGAAISADGEIVVSGGYDRQVKVWAVAGYEEAKVLDTRLFRGHGDSVQQASFAPDGSRVVTASRDRTAITWMTDTGQVEHVLREGHEYLASRTVFFKDGQRVATAAVDNTVRIWSIENGTELLTLRPTGLGAALALTTDQRWVLTGSEPNEDGHYRVKVWDSTTGELLSEFGEHRSQITSLATTLDLVMVGDDGGTCSLWQRVGDGWTQKPLQQDHNGRIQNAALVSETLAVTASSDQTVGIWDLSQGKQVAALSHEGAVTDLALAGDDRHLLTACSDGKARWYDLDSRQLVRTLVADDSTQLTAVDVSHDGRLALTVEADQRRVRIWDLSSGQLLTADGFGGDRARDLIWSARFSPDGSQLLTVGGNTARLWLLPEDPGEGAEVSVVLTPQGPLAAARYSHDGKRIVTASWDNSARIWDAETGKAIRKLEGGHRDRVNDVVFSAQDEWVLTGSSDKTAVLWNVETGEIKQRYVGHAGAVRAVAISPDGQAVITASDDATVRVWNLETAEVIHELPGHSYGVLALAVDSEGKRLVTGGSDREIRIWDLADGRLLRILSGHSAAITSVDISNDGARIVSGSQDQTAKIWDAATSREILTLKGHDKAVTCVRFSPVGTSLLTGSIDGTAILWFAHEWQQ